MAIPDPRHPMFSGCSLSVLCRCGKVFESSAVFSKKEQALITQQPCPRCGERVGGRKAEEALGA